MITESAAIVLYLTDAFPGAGVGRAIGDAQRGPYLSWLSYYAGVVEPVVSLEFAGLGDNPMARRAFRGKQEVGARVLAALRKSAYLVDDAFSGADLLLASMAQWARRSLPADPLVDTWLARINARPALARAMARDGG